MQTLIKKILEAQQLMMLQQKLFSLCIYLYDLCYWALNHTESHETRAHNILSSTAAPYHSMCSDIWEALSPGGTGKGLPTHFHLAIWTKTFSVTLSKHLILFICIFIQDRQCILIIISSLWLGKQTHQMIAKGSYPSIVPVSRWCLKQRRTHRRQSNIID